MGKEEEMREALLNEIDGFFMQLSYLKDLISVDDDIFRYKESLDKVSPNFKKMVECALSDSYSLVLMRLYEKTNEKAVRTIPKLIKRCKNNVHLFSSQKDILSKLDEFETRIEEDEFIVHAIETLSKRRNSQYAHNDKKYFGANLKKDNTILKGYHIRILIKFTEEVLTYSYSILRPDGNVWKTSYNGDLKNLFST